MDEFQLELSELDETQERVEAVANVMLKAQEEGDVERIEAMVEEWIDTLRSGGFQVERMAFLYVANHVLQKTLHSKHPPHFVKHFERHLEEAVSLVSNSPMDRQSVQRLLELWHDTMVFPGTVVLKLWQCTGEDIPLFLAKVAEEDNVTSANGIESSSAPEGSMSPSAFLQNLETELSSAPVPALPKITGHAANPVLNVLKKIDHHKVAIQYLETTIRKNHHVILTQASTRYSTPEEILADSSTSVSMLRQRVEDCLRLTKLRNQLIDQIPVLKKELQAAVKTMIHLEEEALAKNEMRLEQCDLIDIGLADLAEHRELYPTEWMTEASACLERRRQQEEEQREREEEIARLHHSALAESAAHAMSLEADTETSHSALTSLAAQYKTHGDTKERDQKAGEAPTNEMVWHPVLKELVPLQSLNVEWEDWRDH